MPKTTKPLSIELYDESDPSSWVPSTPRPIKNVQDGLKAIQEIGEPGTYRIVRIHETVILEVETVQKVSMKPAAPPQDSPAPDDTPPPSE